MSIQTVPYDEDLRRLFRAAVKEDPDGSFRMLCFHCGKSIREPDRVPQRLRLDCKVPFQQGQKLITRSAVKEPGTLGYQEDNELAFGSSQVLTIVDEPQRAQLDLCEAFPQFMPRDTTPGLVDYWIIRAYSDRLEKHVRLNVLEPPVGKEAGDKGKVDRAPNLKRYAKTFNRKSWKVLEP